MCAHTSWRAPTVPPTGIPCSAAALQPRPTLPCRCPPNPPSPPQTLTSPIPPPPPPPPPPCVPTQARLHAGVNGQADVFLTALTPGVQLDPQAPVFLQVRWEGVCVYVRCGEGRGGEGCVRGRWWGRGSGCVWVCVADVGAGVGVRVCMSVIGCDVRVCGRFIGGCASLVKVGACVLTVLCHCYYHYSWGVLFIWVCCGTSHEPVAHTMSEQFASVLLHALQCLVNLTSSVNLMCMFSQCVLKNHFI